MKIALASDDGKNLSGHVGRCEMFLIFEINDKQITNIEKRANNFTMHRAGNHSHEGHHHENHGEHNHRHNGITAGLNDCKYLICNCAGPGLISDLYEHNIETILTDEMAAESAVNKFIEGSLKSKPEYACHEHHHQN